MNLTEFNTHMNQTFHTANEEFTKALIRCNIDYNMLAQEIDRINEHIDHEATKSSMTMTQYIIGDSVLDLILGDKESETVDCLAHFIAKRINDFDYNTNFSIYHDGDTFMITLYIRWFSVR